MTSTQPGARTGAPQQTCSWRCDRCGKPILDGHGFITFRNPWTGGYPDFTDAEQRRFNEEYRAADAALMARDGRAFSFKELATLPQYPRRVMMDAVHRRCDPLPDHECYWVPVEKLRSPVDVLDWTTHLLTKQWFAADEAKAFIRKFLDGSSVADKERVPA